MDRSIVLCPYCDAENIEGVDSCAECEQPLSHLSLVAPATHVEQCLLTDRVQILVTRPPITASLNTPLRTVLKLLADKAVGCLIVVAGDHPVGIFTERDVLFRLGPASAERGDEPVYHFMTAPVQTLRSDAKIAFAVHQMDLGGFRHIPLVDAHDRLVGVISVRDILRYLTERLAQA